MHPIFLYLVAFFLLINSSVLFFRGLDEVSELLTEVEKLEESERKLLHCGRKLVAKKNIWDSYKVLSLFYPDLEQELKEARLQFLKQLPTSETICNSSILNNFATYARSQANPHYPPHWPNWVVGFMFTSGGLNP